MQKLILEVDTPLINAPPKPVAEPGYLACAAAFLESETQGNVHYRQKDWFEMRHIDVQVNFSFEVVFEMDRKNLKCNISILTE